MSDLTPKDLALNDILSLRKTWCINKISEGGCEGCPIDGGGSMDYCMLTALTTLIEDRYTENMKPQKRREDSDISKLRRFLERRTVRW